MKLTLLDRYKIIKHAVKSAFNPKTKMVICFGVEQGNPELKLTGVYPNGFKYVDPIAQYYARIAANSKDLEELNRRVAGFNSMSVDSYVELNKLNRSDFGVLAKPVRYIPNEVPIEQQPTIEVNVKL